MHGGIRNMLVTQITTASDSADTDIDGVYLDMQGYERVLYLCNIIGTSNTTDAYVMMWASGCATSGGTYLDYTTGTACVHSGVSTATAALDDRYIALEVINPPYRFIGLTIAMTTECMTGECVALQFGAHGKPVSQSSATDGCVAVTVSANPTTA